MSSKLKHDHLLIKIRNAVYQTPCKKYTIEFTNMSYYDDIHWIAKGKGVIHLYGETLADILEKIIEVNPYMDTDLYKVLYETKDLTNDEN